MTRACLVAFLLVIAHVGGCAAPRTGPYAPANPLARDSQRAQALSSRAADLMHEDPEKAESLLREALAADLWHGPAHNNLGVVYLKQGKLYEAAGEFEWARTLMPGHPDPRLNLALTLEKAGRIDEALCTYDTALEVYPNYLPAIQAMARCQVRYARHDERTDDLLREIQFRANDVAWRDWAMRQMASRISVKDHR
jgi:tetratricopeptide (TPR) repeat protein